MARGDGCEFLIFNIIKRLESVPADPLEIAVPEKHGSPLLAQDPPRIPSGSPSDPLIFLSISVDVS